MFLHLPLDVPKALPHFDPTGAPHRHIILLEPNTRIDEIYGGGELRVNSRHHQAVNTLGKGMRVGAKSPDGVIEAIEAEDQDWFCLGVQWHPEADTASALDMQLFECFVQAATRESPRLQLRGCGQGAGGGVGGEWDARDRWDEWDGPVHSSHRSRASTA